MYPVQIGNTAQALLFLLVSSVDHVSPVTGLGSSPTVQISQNGSPFAGAHGAVGEIGDGWYSVAADARDAATLGPLLLHATATGADPSDTVFSVVQCDPLQSISVIQGKVQSIGSASVTYAGPVAKTGDVIILRGYSYETAYGSQLSWSSTGWPDLTLASLSLWDQDAGLVIGTANFSTNSGTQTVAVEISSAETAALEATSHSYILRAEFGAETIALAEGILTVCD